MGRAMVCFFAVCAVLLYATCVSVEAGNGKVPLLADDYVTVIHSPEPKTVYCYSPGIERLASGRLVATMDLGGPGVRKLTGAMTASGEQGKVFTSDDHGKTWLHRADFPFYHERPFVAGRSLYILGHDTDLMIIRSDDGGNTWTKPATLTSGQQWHQAPCNVWRANGKIYLVMERVTDPSMKWWPVSVLAPVVMSAKLDSDLCKRDSWTFSNEIVYRDVAKNVSGLGVPFYTPMTSTAPDNPGDKRTMAPPGWLETNIVQFDDPNNLWHDPSGHTFYLWARAHTGFTNMACIAKAVEADDGSIKVSLATAPSGAKMLYVPCPGGQMKFHIIYDPVDKLFWLLASQATDSMTRPDKLPANRFGLPDNERQRLVLYFSKNCMDWCFAGVVAMGKAANQARSYASMVIDGDDLCVLSRSGDENAKSAHDGDMITFHRVRRFRELEY